MKAILISLYLVLLVATANAWEKYNVDITQEHFPEHAEPDHPLPISREVPEAYYIAQFIAEPSFTSSSRLTVTRKDGRYLIETSLGEGESQFAEIGEEEARLIYSIWTNALFETRYSRKSSGGLDGGTFIFSTYIRGTGWLHGKAWSPRNDAPPLWLLEAANRLFAFVSNKERNTSKLNDELSLIHEKLITYLKRKGA